MIRFLYTRGLLPWRLVLAGAVISLVLPAFPAGAADEQAPEIEVPWEPRE